MKRMLLLITALLIVSAPVFAQEAEKEGPGGNGIGLGFSINYYSKYIWRGIDFYQGDGYIFPSVSWEPFSSGFKITVAAEIASSWMFNGFTKKPGNYHTRSEDYFQTFSLYRKKRQFNNYAYANMGMDFGVEYSHTFENIITLGANVWYYWYYNSKGAREMAWPAVDSFNKVKKWDTSYLSAAINIGLDCVPWVNPKIAVYYDYYTGYKRGGDYYVQLGFSHDFEIVKDVVSVTPAVTAGYYIGRTYGYNNYFIASLGGPDLSLIPIDEGGDDFIMRQHVRPKKGVSDIDPSVTLTVTKGGLTFTSGFYWVITPSRSWQFGGPVHKYYTQVGIAYNL